jgi:hypothetical protein
MRYDTGEEACSLSMDCGWVPAFFRKREGGSSDTNWRKEKISDIESENVVNVTKLSNDD